MDLKRRLSSCTRSVLAVVLTSLVALPALVASTPASAAVAGDPLAASLGVKPNEGFLELGALTSFERWLGTQVSWTVQMTDKRSGPQLVNSVNAQTGPGSPLAGVQDRVSLVLTVPLAFGTGNAQTPAGIKAIGQKLRDVANGDYDDSYRAVATTLKQRGFGDTVIRLGHEMTGDWYPWSSLGNETAFIAAWRHVYGVMNAAAPGLRFDFNVARTNFSRVPDAYPGDAYVDVIGMDVYYNPLTDPDWSENRWVNQYEAPLEQLRAFASTHRKPISFPEWAQRGYDEPEFIRRMRAHFDSLPRTGPASLLYHSYFDTQDEHALETYPASGSEYRRLFGKGAVPPPPPPTTTTKPTTTTTAKPPTTTTKPSVTTTTKPPATTKPPPAPSISVADTDVLEGDADTTSLRFRIDLSSPAVEPVTFLVSTRDGTATSVLSPQGRRDFRPLEDVEIRIEAGETRAWVGVAVVGDVVYEPDRKLQLVVTNLRNATAQRLVATGTILDDD